MACFQSNFSNHVSKQVFVVDCFFFFLEVILAIISSLPAFQYSIIVFHLVHRVSIACKNGCILNKLGRWEKDVSYKL